MQDKARCRTQWYNDRDGAEREQQLFVAAKKIGINPSASHIYNQTKPQKHPPPQKNTQNHPPKNLTKLK